MIKLILLIFTIYFVFLASVSVFALARKCFKEGLLFHQKSNQKQIQQHLTQAMLFSDQSLYEPMIKQALCLLHQDRYFLKHDLSQIDWNYLSKKNDYFLVQYRYYLKQYVLFSKLLKPQYHVNSYIHQMHQAKVLTHQTFFKN